jgi:hypothetical protein
MWRLDFQRQYRFLVAKDIVPVVQRLSVAAMVLSAASVAHAQFQILPVESPVPQSQSDVRWPSRFAGCGELIPLLLRYRVDPDTLYEATLNEWEYSTPCLKFSGWGADLRREPSGTLELQPFTPSQPWRSVARTRDGDGLAGVAWPDPVVATGQQWLPILGIQPTVVLGTAYLRAPLIPDQQTTDVVVTLESTLGDITEGMMQGGDCTTHHGKLVTTHTPSMATTLIRVVNIRRCLADIAGPGQSHGPDGQYTADDIIVFFNLFFAGHPLADIASPGQGQVPDGDFTADDIIVYLNWFFGGCQPQLPCGTDGLIAPPATPKSRRAGPSAAGPVPTAPSLDAATIAAMQQLINTLPPGSQRDQLQAQLDARLGTGVGQAVPGQPTQAPGPAPSPGNR